MLLAWLQVLRGLKPNAILTGNMQPSQHKRWKLRGPSRNGQQQAAAQSRMGACSGAKQTRLDSAKEPRAPTGAPQYESAGPCRGASSLEAGEKYQQANCSDSVRRGLQEVQAGSEKPSAEERKARKRAKKQKQKQAAEADPARKAQEKAKKAKRKALRKARLSGSSSV